MFLGANGWHPDYDRPLGNPLGPPVNSTGGNGERLLVRKFESGTNVTWDLVKGTGIINWSVWWFLVDAVCACSPPPRFPSRALANIVFTRGWHNMCRVVSGMVVRS